VLYHTYNHSLKLHRTMRKSRRSEARRTLYSLLHVKQWTVHYAVCTYQLKHDSVLA